MEKKLNKSFFPKDNDERKHPVTNLALLRLTYLATVNSEGKKSYFTKNQLKVLRTSDYYSGCTIWGLRIGLLVCTVMLVGISYLGFAQSEDSTLEFKVGLATVAACVAAITTALSFWATGFSPHWTSNAFNDKQDTLLDMREVFEDLGYKLIALYYSEHRENAIAIAKNINTNNLVRDIGDTIHHSDQADRIVLRLEEAIKFITSEEKIMPDNTQLEYFIRDRAGDFRSK